MKLYFQAIIMSSPFDDSLQMESSFYLGSDQERSEISTYYRLVFPAQLTRRGSELTAAFQLEKYWIPLTKHNIYYYVSLNL